MIYTELIISTFLVISHYLLPNVSLDQFQFQNVPVWWIHSREAGHPWHFRPMESKTVLYFGFHAVDSGFQVLQSGFQSETVFRIPWAVFWNPKPRDSGLNSKISWIPESVHKRKFPQVRNPDSPTWGEYFPWAAGRVISAMRSTSGEPDSKQVAVISKENSRFRFPFQNKRTPFHIMFRL